MIKKVIMILLIFIIAISGTFGFYKYKEHNNLVKMYEEKNFTHENQILGITSMVLDNCDIIEVHKLKNNDYVQIKTNVGVSGTERLVSIKKISEKHLNKIKDNINNIEHYTEQVKAPCYIVTLNETGEQFFVECSKLEI